MKNKKIIKSYRIALKAYFELIKYYKYASTNYKCSKYKTFLMYYIYMIGELQEDIKRVKINLNKLKR